MYVKEYRIQMYFIFCLFILQIRVFNEIVINSVYQDGGFRDVYDLYVIVFILFLELRLQIYS